MSCNGFNLLPTEINHLIFSHLDLSDLARMNCASKESKKSVDNYLATTIELWKNCLSPQRQKVFEEKRSHSKNMFEEIKNIQNISLDTLGSKLIHYAASKSKFDLRAIILLNGNPNATDNEGNTPLHRAALSSIPAHIAILLSAGANKTAQDRYHKTPLDIVHLLISCHPEAVSPLQKEYDQIIQMLK